MRHHCPVPPKFPAVSPPPADFTNAMASMMGGVLWVAALFGLAISVVAIVGALKRWTWTYYAVLILLGLSVASVPLALVNTFGGSPFTTGSAAMTMPSWTYVVGLLTGIPAVALFAWMLVALVKRGPWAMRKVPHQVS